MKNVILAALLLAATAFAPSASAIACTTGLSPVQFCIGGGPCVIHGDVQPCDEGVCVEGERLAGGSCTVDVPVHDDVCLGEYRPLDDLREMPRSCLDTRDTGTAWFERCNGSGYALFVAGAGVVCFLSLP